jgi:hypothetical protein
MQAALLARGPFSDCIRPLRYPRAVAAPTDANRTREATRAKRTVIAATARDGGVCVRFTPLTPATFHDQQVVLPVRGGISPC